MGWHHIISWGALDHILFIAALAVIYSLKEWKQVLILITAFTIGHSVTLALTVFDVIRFSSKWVEFLIPCTIVITSFANLFQKEFNRNYYEKIDKLNKEEQGLVERLDLEALPNIKYWVRNREKTDPFYIQGWKKNKFYPDFIVVTNKGTICALEWKGEDRLSNDDTEYKLQIGEIWQELGNGKTKFFLVHNTNIEQVLNELKQQ